MHARELGPADSGVLHLRRYWVRTVDVSAVKHHVLQHLPVSPAVPVRGSPCSCTSVVPSHPAAYRATAMHLPLSGRAISSFRLQADPAAHGAELMLLRSMLEPRITEVPVVRPGL